MKARDLRDRSTEDLTELERSLANERFQGKFKNFTNRLDDTSIIRKNKRDLARVKLILTERARGIVVVSKPLDGEQKPKTRAPKPAPEPKKKEAAPEAEATQETKAEPKETKKAKAAAPKAKAAAPKATGAPKVSAKKPTAPRKSGRGE
jgi:large subunit ribosomal protein L29